ncbi:alpha/beta fold hydrolase [Paenibacillus gansuensis]|uniref:Alpha/beta fold hydrolase n=1 Tax=Paenibacillus gansuensis TaxID=306542 RepID=A0ABW5P770_9BACL
MIRYKKMNIEGIDLFFREAGSPGMPAIVLLHGFPTSSFMFRDLIPLLADRFHVIAPDYPGYGNSSAPSPQEFSYTFEHISILVEKLLDAMGIRQMILYVHDYGGPVGFRMAIRNPRRVAGFVIQNTVVNEEGLGQPFDLFKALWADRNPRTEAAFAQVITFDFTRRQYLQGACQPYFISPDGYNMDQPLLDRPGNSSIQLELGYDYRTNVEQYPVWQQYLRRYQPPVLVAWGKNDFIFTLDGALFFNQVVSYSQTSLLCGGHFVLEEQSVQISHMIKDFFGQILAPL